jgi:tetratricopeptide (TPR) repeat protein
MARGPVDFHEHTRDAGQAANEAIGRLAAEINEVVRAGDHKRAAGLASEVCTLIKQTWPDAPHPSFASYFELAGVLHSKAGDLRSAESALREALHMRRAIHGNDHPEVALALQRLGDVSTQTGRLDEAASLLLEARDVMERAGEQPDGDLVYLLSQLAVAFRQQGNRKKGAQILEAAVRVAQAAGDEAVLVTAQFNLATFYEEMGDHAKAIPLLEPTLVLTRRLVDQMLAAGGRSRESIEMEFGIPSHLSRLGKAYLAMGAPARAVPMFDEALTIRRKELGEDHPEVGRTLALLAEAYEASGNPQRAASLYQDATTILRENPR